MHFSHWPNAAANWLGPWNLKTNQYDFINLDNVERSVKISKSFIERWGQHASFAAFQPVNEPWWNSDMGVLKGYYRQVRKIV